MVVTEDRARRRMLGLAIVGLVLVVCAVIFTQHARLWLAQERARDAEAALTDCQQRGRFTLVADE